jgi:hypothetical protein
MTRRRFRIRSWFKNYYKKPYYTKETRAWAKRFIAAIDSNEEHCRDKSLDSQTWTGYEAQESRLLSDFHHFVLTRLGEWDLSND